MPDNNIDVTYGKNYFKRWSIQCILVMAIFSILSLFFLNTNVISYNVSATIGLDSSHGSATPTQSSNQLLVEYSYTKNPVKIGEKTYLLITVMDKFSGEPISDASVKLAIGPTLSTIRNNILSMALSAVSTTSAQKLIEDKTMQTMRTDSNGYAAFTIQLGPESDVGPYDTEIEVSKRSYQSSFNQVDLNVISESQRGEMSSEDNNDGDAVGGDGGDGGDAVGGDGGDGGDAVGGDGGDGGDAVGGNAVGGDGGDGGRNGADGVGNGADGVGNGADGVGNGGNGGNNNGNGGNGGNNNGNGGNGADGGDGGDGGDAVGLVLDELDCNDTPTGGGNRGKDGDDGADEILLC
jgi:hypothetical protein